MPVSSSKMARRHAVQLVVSLLLSCAVQVTSLALPSSELLNRRKSPALWREDLQQGDSKADEATGEEPRKRIATVPPEVMAPVGGFPQLEAAIGNGADAIYLGLSAFSARARAANFDPETELPRAVKIAHDAGVKVYVALNTLIFDHELAEVETLVRQCARANVDALIVQDLGLARMVRDIAPSLHVHASTQQTITSADGAAFISDLVGTTRVVLGRELSTNEIDLVATTLNDDIEIETFVHGALCVSYSGQCFSSEVWGGRSANRGQCAQGCRLPYGLIDNGELKELGDFSYLLSPQDLCGLDHVPALVEAGVSCLKIEGRLKDSAFVAATTRAYRNAVDEAWEAHCLKYGLSFNPRKRVTSREEVTKAELAQIFSRGQDEKNDGLTPGFFDGSKHQMLVRGRSPRHRGVHIGRVGPGSSCKHGLVIATDSAEHLKLGDGIVVDRGMAQDEELGGSIFDIYDDDHGQTVIRFSRDVQQKWKKHDDMARKGLGDGEPFAPEGAHVWKTNDATVDKKMKKLSQSPAPRKTMGVAVTVTGKLGEELMVRIDDGDGNIGVGTSESILVPAERAGLSHKSVVKAIGTLGNTEWSIDGEIDTAGVDDSAWCPVSWIKEARRQAIEDLGTQVGGPATDDGNDDNDVESTFGYNVASRMLRQLHGTDSESDSGTTARKSHVSVLARNYDQVDALCQMAEEGERIDEIIVDFLEVDGMRDAVHRIRQTRVKAIVASPRIIKPGESGIWKTLLKLEADALLVRSNGLLFRMMKLGGSGAIVDVGNEDGKQRNVKIPELIGDFSLNVSNAITAWELLQYGCSRVTAAYDLSAMAITELLDTLGTANAEKVEIVVHTHLPIFHTEHCVFARFLSNGDSYVDCGHICTRHNVHLRDQTGADNLVLADMGCRNTVFSAEAQSGVHSLFDWMDAGGSRFRIELVDESPEDSRLIVQGYLSVLGGSSRPYEVWDTLEKVRDSNGRIGGVSHGSLRNKVERRAGEL